MRIPVSGFLTTEMRVAGSRVGFRVEAVGGSGGILAHIDYPGPLRVGPYGVDLVSFEEVAIPALTPPFEGVVVIDELGPMELASDRFVSAVVGLFEEEEVPVLATVHARRHPFTDLLIGRNDTDLVAVTAENRDVLPGVLAGRLAAAVR